MASIPVILALRILSDQEILRKYFWFHKTWDELGWQHPEDEKKMQWALNMKKEAFDDR
jgi:hypothetical protein